VGRVNGDQFAIGTGTVVQIAAPLAGVFRRQAESSERMAQAGSQFEQAKALVTVFVGLAAATE